MSIKHQRVKIVNGALQTHRELLWIEANNSKVRVEVVYVDTEDKISDKDILEKYASQRKSIENLIEPSAADLILGRSDRVRESFNYAFKDGTVTIFCELKPGGYS